MFDFLIRWSLAHRTVVLALALGVLVWGGWTATRVPLDVLPDLTAPTVTILLEAPGMAPGELESLVTYPLEASLNGAPGLRRLRSATAIGVSVIWAEFDWGQEIHRARQIVAEKLAAAQSSLPPGVKPPYLAPMSSIMGEILFIALESDRHSAMELRTTADTVLRRRLLAVPGVAQVIPTGGEQKQYQVLVSPESLREYAITLFDVENALRTGSTNASAGFLVASGQEYLIQGIGRMSSPEAIGEIVITQRNGRPIRIRDVAASKLGPALKRAEGSHNGRPAVIVGIQKQPGANTLELMRRLDATLTGIESGLSPGMRIDRHVFRQSDFIERALSNLTRALRDGAFLVVVVVAVFLMNARAAWITLLAIPLSLVTAVISMSAFGLTINSMSLGGLAIAIGELVDDAIIDVENVMRRLRQHPDRPQLSVIYEASREIRGSVVFATAIVILVFLPLFALSSVEGRLLAPLGFAYISSLGASLLVALTVTPVLASLAFAHSTPGAIEPWLSRQLKRFYQPVLDFCLNHPRVLLLSAFLLVSGSSYLLSQMGRSFLPEFNEGTLTISAVTLPGTSLRASDGLGRALERVLLSIPEVGSTARRTGRSELDEHVQGVESAEIDVTLKSSQRTKAEVLSDIRERTMLIPGMSITIGQPISHRIDHMLSGTRANIAIKIFGDDLGLLRQLARQAAKGIEDTPGLVDLSVEQQMDVPALRIVARPQDAARYGLQPGLVSSQLETAFLGREVNRVLEGQLSFPLVLRYDGEASESWQRVQRTLLDTPSGVKVPVEAVASLQQDLGPNFISRENVQRRIVVQANAAGRDVRGLVGELQTRLARALALPPGYRIEYGGQFESEAESTRRLSLLTAGVIIGILLILATAFQSWRDALIIMLNLPLALAGGVVGVAASGGIVSVASLIGFITLFGIATRNGIMLVSHIHHLRRQEGVADLREAVRRGATERLVPILMAALAAGLALIPIALSGTQPGSEIQAPLAMVILSGLLTSTALNMLVVPAVYLSYGRR
ncbi:MAG: CusA/CzcA family heavy metal efflux RND transporter [Bryobacter sp.]|jgi:CzcA family heavy metal efflux pump|nr:CusA/CzcA family heavy metal efflux RND transporter [Bryobacter sp. CoA8 C33]